MHYNRIGNYHWIVFDQHVTKDYVKELAFSKYVLSKKAGLCPAGGGGLFLACEDFGRMFDSSFPACTFFLLLFKVEISSHTQFHSLDQDQSTVAQQAETTVTKCSLMSCMWACFLIGSHTMPGQQHSTLWLHFGQRWMWLGVTCHLHFLQNDQGLLHATAVTWGWNRHQIRAHKVDSGE